VTVDFCLSLKSHRLSVDFTGAVTTENIHTRTILIILTAMSSLKKIDCEQAFV